MNEGVTHMRRIICVSIFSLLCILLSVQLSLAGYPRQPSLSKIISKMDQKELSI